ncbi:hypothetical protein TrRE_jg10479 [Triparma retinervis]|uniref:Uncharacterized protein n=1 Tax=Triparma retinervis TaxID=2557542 RepID=A0A9W7F543_9STRA|nr:hypothetical protein TrRE_jg10479 [Triparma retinervis]
MPAREVALLDVNAAIAVCVDNRPLSMYSTPSMKRFIGSLRPSYPPPDGNKIADVSAELANVVRRKTTEAISRIKLDLPFLKANFSTDGWQSPSGHHLESLIINIVSPTSFEHFKGVVGLRKLTGNKSGARMHEQLSDMVAKLRVGWKDLKSAAYTLTHDSAANMFCITNATETTVIEQNTEEINVPALGTDIYVCVDETGFYLVSVVSVTMDPTNPRSIKNMDLHYVTDSGQRSTHDFLFVKDPWWGFVDPANNDIILGAPSLSLTKAPEGWSDDRSASKIFGDPLRVVSETHVPGVFSIACCAHILATVLSIVVEKKRKHLGFGEFFVPEAAQLFKRIETVGTHLHFLGDTGDKFEAYEKCRIFSEGQDSKPHAKCPVETQTRWFSRIPVLRHFLTYQHTIMNYITAFNSSGKELRRNAKVLPTFTPTDIANLNGILTAVDPYKEMNVLLQSDQISFGGAWHLLCNLVNAPEPSEDNIDDEPAAAHNIESTRVAAAFHKGLRGALKRKFKLSYPSSHTSLGVAASFLTPAIARMTKRMHAEHDPDTDTLTHNELSVAFRFADEIYKTEDYIKYLRDSATHSDSDGGELDGDSNKSVEGSLDPSPPAKQVVSSLLSSHLGVFSESEDEEEESAEDVPEMSLDEKLGIRATAKEEIAEYLDLCKNVSLKKKASTKDIMDSLSVDSVLAFFKKYTTKHGLHRLSFLATQLCIIKITSAEDERLFSFTGDMSRGKRGSLGPGRMEDLCLVGKMADKFMYGDTVAETEKLWIKELPSVKKAKMTGRGSASKRSKNVIDLSKNVTELLKKGGAGV